MPRLVLAALVAIALMPTRTSAQNGAEAGEGELPAVVFDIHLVAGAAAELVGCEVLLREVRVERIESAGFWVAGTDVDHRVVVSPAERDLISVEAGGLVTIHGDVRLFTPELAMRLTLEKTPVVYVYAYTVRPAAPR